MSTTHTVSSVIYSSLQVITNLSNISTETQHTTAMKYITLCGTKPQRTLFLKKQDPTNVFLNQNSLINHSNGVFKQVYYIKLRCIGSAISVKTADFRHCNFIRLILIHSNYTNIDYLLKKNCILLPAREQVADVHFIFRGFYTHE